MSRPYSVVSADPGVGMSESLVHFEWDYWVTPSGDERRGREEPIRKICKRHPASSSEWSRGRPLRFEPSLR